LHRPIATIVLEVLVDVTLEHLDVRVIHADELTQ
jgi:hypothetical protein